MKIKSLLLGAGISIMIFGNAEAHILDEATEWNGHYYKIFEMEMKWNWDNLKGKRENSFICEWETKEAAHESNM